MHISNPEAKSLNPTQHFFLQTFAIQYAIIFANFDMPDIPARTLGVVSLIIQYKKLLKIDRICILCQFAV